MNRRGTLHKRLEDTRTELQRLRAQLRVLDEQVVYVADVASEAETRAVVAGTPLADRERREAAEDLRRAQRERELLAQRIDALVDEQNSLLDRLTASS